MKQHNYKNIQSLLNMYMTNMRLENVALALLSQSCLAPNAANLEIPLIWKEWFCRIENLKEMDLPVDITKNESFLSLILDTFNQTIKHMCKKKKHHPPANSVIEDFWIFSQLF